MGFAAAAVVVVLFGRVEIRVSGWQEGARELAGWMVGRRRGGGGYLYIFTTILYKYTRSRTTRTVAAAAAASRPY